jgi:hypothetical protein
MRVSIINVYNRRMQRNVTSCGAKMFSVEHQSDGDIRIVAGLVAVWLQPNRSGLMIGDAGYYNSYAECPSTWRRLTRWIGFRTGSLPSVSRPRAEYTGAK